MEFLKIDEKRTHTNCFNTPEAWIFEGCTRFDYDDGMSSWVYTEIWRRLQVGLALNIIFNVFVARSLPKAITRFNQYSFTFRIRFVFLFFHFISFFFFLHFICFNCVIYSNNAGLMMDRKICHQHFVMSEKKKIKNENKEDRQHQRNKKST